MPFNWTERQQDLFIMVLRGVGFIVGGVIVALGIYFLASGTDTSEGSVGDEMKNTILDIYRIIFGALIMLAELRMRHLLIWFSFMLYYIGLGFFYVFVGGLALGSQWYEYVLAIVACCLGFAYCGVACMCSEVEKKFHGTIKADVEAAQL